MQCILFFLGMIFLGSNLANNDIFICCNLEETTTNGQEFVTLSSLSLSVHADEAIQKHPPAYMHLEQSMKHKLLKDKLTPNKDENNGDAKRQPFGVKDINNNMAYEAEESLSGGFWILKPCTFLEEWQQNSSEALKLPHFT
ncbi:uncharacterized protein LOC119341837 [Triticum dicoccoides]|uniref:uncharacterized protein LOC119341837 n=1 Tax=Triticum dicoccoides TaxID=85692 RepID=UPI0018918B4B|nr:uncharacterized protein LOC119341837 [Triticum dicoccoides]